MRFEPAVSIVINTNGRRESLARTLVSLRYLKYKKFEVCVVCGPAKDGTREMVQGWADPIRTASCDVQNLSCSRNIGIEMASGEVVAFIDDDAIPEPEWLSDIVAAFEDPRVGGAGGIVLDNTGVSVQHQFVVTDRLARADLSRQEPAVGLDYPFSYRFPHLTGTNCAFRREALVEISGFDEQFEYFLDETDLCLRLHDAGWMIQHVDRARLHHKFAPSHLRDENRVTNPFPILKNKIYFCLQHGRSYHSVTELISECTSFARFLEDELNEHHRAGRLSTSLLDHFRSEIERAWSVGLAAGLTGVARTRAIQVRIPERFTPFVVQAPSQPKVLAFLSQSFPPRPANGVSRYVDAIARSLARRGHHVHVITDGGEFDTVDFEDGVWVHRLSSQEIGRSISTAQRKPAALWHRTARYCDALIGIDRLRRIDAVEAPSWDAEAAASLLSGLYPTAVNVVTTMSHYLDSHPELREDGDWMEANGLPIQAAEELVFGRATVLICASHAIRDELLARYDVPEKTPIVICPHGLPDPAGETRRAPPGVRTALISVLFVGRLEERKAPELLLEAAANLLVGGRPDVVFWFAGDDTLMRHDGLTAGQYYKSLIPADLEPHVQFLGSVSDEQLRWLYASCDILAVPSRFESFGLTAIEAMAFGKPVIASRVGGLAEIIEDGKTGFAVPPDAEAFRRALIKLIDDSDLRRRLGEAGRSRYEASYSIKAVTARREEILSAMMRDIIDFGDVTVSGHAEFVDLPFGEKGISIKPGASVAYRADAGSWALSFWCHRWSGTVVVTGPALEASFNLHREDEGLEAKELTSRAHGRWTISNPGCDGKEVIIFRITKVAVAL